MTCTNCINRECMLDHRISNDCLKRDSSGNFLYLLFQNGGSFEARYKLHQQLEREGLLNQVIGGSGEHEINAKWDIKTAYRHLSETCEQVGGLVWRESDHLVLNNYNGRFEITFDNGLCAWKPVKIY